MRTREFVRQCKQELKRQPWEKGDGYICDNDTEYRSLYIGSVFSLDPCGRYHDCLSPNGVTSTCEHYWNMLERECDKQGMSLSSGEGDPCDMFVAEYRDRKDNV